MRFTGGCEPLCKVDVRDLVTWITAAFKPEDWHKTPERPFVRVDPMWEGFGERSDPVVAKVLEHFPGCSDTYRALTVIHPGDYVAPHTDTQSPEWISRIHIPLVTNPEAKFAIDGIGYHLEVGNAYQVNPGKRHSVFNFGKESRIHLMFDVVRVGERK